MQRTTVRFGDVFSTDLHASKPYAYAIRTPNETSTLRFATFDEAEQSRERMIGVYKGAGHDVIVVDGASA